MTEMERQINEISKDIFEIESLLNVSRRQRIKNFLSLELRKLISEKRQLEESFRDEKTSEAKKNRDPLDVKNVRVKIDNYAWDQSPKYVKFFLTLKKVHQLDSEDIKCQFGSDYLSLTVKNLENKDYFFDVQKLLHPVVPEKSYWRVKSDTIVIFLVKSSALKWPFLTRIDEESASKKNNKYGVDKTEKHDENSLFSLVKDMYEKGDDRLKRTIAQAWTEGQSSKGYI
ncbi:calcyclin-binding protein-like [Coccinella septempunctata]|uniref:calcyclin-binding protein-like n=1 Tax=Coccinella septempunctata TaxID=41139 RepID=UPI001D093D66|nr:calcyclin-binding protein-like [Coccinella septempunctata]